MQKRVIIIHGWRDRPDKGWMAWLRVELEALGVTVLAPAFPSPDQPQIEQWLELLEAKTGGLGANDVLVGHSLGCLIAMKALLDRAKTPVAGIVMVAGFVDPERLDTTQVVELARRRVCIYSDNDQTVKPEQSKQLAKAISAKEVLDPGKGHFSTDHDNQQLPSILNEVVACFIKV